ncbi:MAG TPA: response regulator [Alphaproteobacteria bacterium]|nr:response regulator [Alphaproteobacteria bacterium]
MSLTVLIVEDELFVRMSIAEYLRDEGFHVIEAANGDEAMAVLRGGTPISLVFTDVRMPGSIDGCELAKQVRARWPHVPVILTSGYSEELLSARSISEDIVVPKPYRPQAILTTIRAVLPAETRQP